MNPTVLLVGNFLSTRKSTPQPCEQLAARLEHERWPVLRTSRRSLPPLRLLDMLATVAVRSRQYDVAYLDVFSGRAFWWANAVSGLLAALGKPMVMALHGGALPEFAQRHPERVKKVLDRAQAVTAPSLFLADAMAEQRSDILVQRNGFDLEAFSYRLRERVRPRLVWVRAFHEIYAPQDAVRVLHRVRQDHPDATLTMLGADKDGSKARVVSLAAQLGLTDALHLPGSVTPEKVPEFLADADIFLNTSTVDNAPRSLVEAMACGLCVVSTDVGGVPYLIDHQADGLLVPAQQPLAMAEEVLRLIDTPELARCLSEHARTEARQFDWSVVVPQWQKLLTALTESGARAAEACHVRS